MDKSTTKTLLINKTLNQPDFTAGPLIIINIQRYQSLSNLSQIKIFIKLMDKSTTKTPLTIKH
jgi:hypothetical protein